MSRGYRSIKGAEGRRGIEITVVKSSHLVAKFSI